MYIKKALRCILFCFSIININYAMADDTPEKVYRGVGQIEDPASVKRAGGFYSTGISLSTGNNPPINISLYNHVRGQESGASNINSGYVSTSSSFSAVNRWVTDFLMGRGWIYHIRPTPNFIGVNQVLGSYSPYPIEYEYSALGVIHWRQVIGWQRVACGVPEPFIPNPDFSPELFPEPRVSVNQFQLAGFPDNHPAWGRAPWLEFAECELRSSCSPKKSAQKYGEEFYEKSVVFNNAFRLSLINY